MRPETKELHSEVEIFPVKDTSDMKGYNKLAALFASDPCVASYQRFAKLNHLNLLYYQAEILHLQEDYEDIVSEDMDSRSPEKKGLPYSVWDLKMYSSKTGEKNLQWERFQEIRALLEKYSEFEPFIFHAFSSIKAKLFVAFKKQFIRSFILCWHEPFPANKIIL